MINNLCALTRVPVADGDRVVMVVPTPGSLSCPWDRSRRVCELASSVTRGVYQSGWLAQPSLPRQGDAGLFTALFLHEVAWSRAVSLGNGESELGRVIDFSCSCGVRLDHAVDLKTFGEEVSRPSLMAFLDLCDELARRLPEGR